MAASAQVVYGQVLWNPLDVVALWDNRAGKFFVGFLFALANMYAPLRPMSTKVANPPFSGTNVAGNSIPFANDVTNMFPKYMSIRRGQFLCAILGFAICPWLIQAKAGRFLAFLNGYSVFLGPLLGVLLSDYLLIRKARGFNIYNLYKPHGLYWYTKGVNPRAVIAFLTGVAPLLPGLVHAINPDIKGIEKGILNFYSMSWFEGLVMSGLTYYLLFLAFPFPTTTDDEDKAQVILEGKEYEDLQTEKLQSTSSRSSQTAVEKRRSIKDGGADVDVERQ